MIPTNLLPEEYRGQWCVAGGFAACPALAEDIDVWVHGIPTADLEAARTKILEHLVKIQFPAHARSAQFVFEEAVETRTQASYMQEFIQIKKVAKIYGRRSWRELKPIHIMVTDAPGGAGSIIAGFDISTHAVAIDHDGRVWTNRYTHPGLEPQRLASANEYTEPRMQRVCARYGHPYIPKETLIG
jgi:hypothetical protein